MGGRDRDEEYDRLTRLNNKLTEDVDSDLAFLNAVVRHAPIAFIIMVLVIAL